MKKVAIFTALVELEDGTPVVGGSLVHMKALLGLLQDMGIEPVLVQTAPECWVRTHEGVPLHAFPSSEHPGFRDLLMACDAAIYVTIHTQRWYHPRSLVLQHGIYADNPEYGDLDEWRRLVREHVKPALDQGAVVACMDVIGLNALRFVLQDCDLSRIEWAPNAVDLEKFAFQPPRPSNSLNVLYPRRICPSRGIHLMLELVPQVLAHFPNVRFTFATDRNVPHLLEWFTAWVESQPERSRISVIHPTHDAMPQVYADSDVVVLPTKYTEAASYSALEAQAVGRPVIATNVGSLPATVIDGFSGRIVSGSVEAFIEAIWEYAKDPALRAKHGAQGRALVESAFGQKAWAARWRRIILRVLSGG